MLEWLQEFGLGHHDFPTLVSNVSILLRALALNIDSSNKKRIPILCYIMMLASTACFIYTFQVSAYWFIFFRDADEERLKKIIAFSQSVSSLMGAAKFLHVYFNAKELKGIIDVYLHCHSRVIPNSRMSDNIAVTLKTVKKRALVFWVIIVANAFLYLVVRPLVVSDRHSMKDYQLLWGLEPLFDSPNYEITVTVIALVTIVAAYGPSHITILLIVIVGYNEAQMIALSQELLNVWDDAKDDYSKVLETNPVTNKRISLDECVKHRLDNIMHFHALNQQLVLQVESVFKNAFAFQITLLSISLVADLLSGLENTYTLIPFTVSLVGMDCFTGQNLLDASTEFEAAVYRCRWENFDKTNKRSVLMMLQSAQKNLQLSAGGVTSLNYAFFMQIINSIYSMFAALGQA